ncbi:MAG: EAL domain-containing protein, partial [Pseudomonadota bacterium]
VKLCADAATGDPAVLVTAVDVSELKTARDKARYLADRDQLTGCYNRSFVQQKLDEIAQGDRHENLALLFIDVDRFKLINDNFGHDVGDHVLCACTQRIEAHLTEADTLARLGGDEFLVLLGSVADDAELVKRVETIAKSISKPVLHRKTRLNVTASVGVALVPPEATDWAEYMRRADVALYASKQAGRNQHSIFNLEMGRAVSERNRVEKDLKIAIEQDQFVLHVQPRVDLRTGRVVSGEILVRWNHPTKGLIFPDQFIPIAEETGMIEELGAIVLKRGCGQAAEWLRRDIDINVSVNVSPRQFLNENFLATITELANAPDFKPGNVELEITETVLIGDHDLIAERLRRVTELGFRLAIDDFGTGYSNLAYISRFPLNCIKIDKSFVDQLPETGPIVRLIQTMAEQIGATTVAEGAETESQIRMLAALGCEQIQGYYYSKPVPLSEMGAAIADIHWKNGVF